VGRRLLRVMTVVRRFGACEAGKIYPACGCAGALGDLWAWGSGAQGWAPELGGATVMCY
jgi:hypothetical protein